MKLPHIEDVASKVHHSWMTAMIEAGFTSRKSVNGEELMVPYNELSEQAKELDRASVKAVYTAIMELNNANS